MECRLLALTGRVACSGRFGTDRGTADITRLIILRLSTRPLTKPARTTPPRYFFLAWQPQLPRGAKPLTARLAGCRAGRHALAYRPVAAVKVRTRRFPRTTCESRTNTVARQLDPTKFCSTMNRNSCIRAASFRCVFKSPVRITAPVMLLAAAVRRLSCRRSAMRALAGRCPGRRACGTTGFCRFNSNEKKSL